MFGLKPLLGLEPMAPIRPQLLVSHANHSATETSMYVCMYVFMYVVSWLNFYIVSLPVLNSSVYYSVLINLQISRIVGSTCDH